MRTIIALFIGISAMLTAVTYPSYDGYVTDTAGILDSAYHDYLEKLLTALDQKTTAQIAVATIPSLDGEDLAEYNVNLFKKWGIGRAGKDNGILFLISAGDRRMRIETGYGLEGALPDATAKGLLHNIVRPLFKDGKMTEGITAGTEAIAEYVCKEYKLALKDLGVPRPSAAAVDRAFVSTNTSADGSTATARNKTPSWVFLIAIAIIIVIIVIASRRSKGVRASAGTPGLRRSDEEKKPEKKSGPTFGGGKSGGGGAGDSW